MAFLKGPFVDLHLIKKVDAARATATSAQLKPGPSLHRSADVCRLHHRRAQWSSHVPVYVTENMVGLVNFPDTYLQGHAADKTKR